MSRTASGSTYAAGLLRRSAAPFALGFVMLFAQSGGHAQAADPLTFFKNYFITGDYVVGGVGLRGLGGVGYVNSAGAVVPGIPGIAAREITISGVPSDADIVAAFLYWQVVSKNSLGPDSGATGVKFRGNPLTSTAGPIAKVLNPNGTAPCWSSGGATGSPGGQHRTYTYRTDVLGFFDVDENPSSPRYGKFIVNGPHEVQLPDSGPAGSAVPIALGASLVLVYRDPTMPLNAIVLYDGGYTMDQSTQLMSQTIKGFYQAKDTTARITHIVGSGQLNKSEVLRLPGKLPITEQNFLVNPFTGFAGASWDNPTYDLHNVTVTSSADYGDSVTTSVDHEGFSAFDCLSWGAVIYRTAVLDTDGDGLLNMWETSSSTAPVKDPNGRDLPYLQDIGANPNVKDLFVEVGYMHAAEGTTYGGAPQPEHSHLPDPVALKKVGDAFWCARAVGCDASTPAPPNGIQVHFDAGNGYPTYLGPDAYAERYMIRGTGLARGGEAIDENVTVCTRGATDPPTVCQFSAYPGTVGWKTGFRFLRDQLLSATPPLVTPDGLDPCDGPVPGDTTSWTLDGPGGVCERRFDHNRKDIFHYVLGAHFLGLPNALCLNPDGSSSDDLACQQNNPDFHIPRTNSGIDDFPGADLMLTLGGFADAAGKPVGTPFMQGSTLMHELGHTFELTHVGVPLLSEPGHVPLPPEHNCKPNYLSGMNYLFQLRGLFKDDGVPRMDYSGEVLGGIDEFLLTNGPLSGAPRYRTRWYAPQSAFTVGSAVTKFCNGSAFPDPLPAGWVPMVRVDGPSVVGGSIDWNPDSSPSTTAQDINFDGVVARLAPPVEGRSLKAGSNDWASLRLNQVGSRRNVGGLSLDVGSRDLGSRDLGSRDLGSRDLGSRDLGSRDLGSRDLGSRDLGSRDLGSRDLGVGATDEADDKIAAASGYGPPNEFEACVIGPGQGKCAGVSVPLHRNRLDWTPPTVGSVLQYRVYRYRVLADGTVTPPAVPVGTPPDGTPVGVAAGVVDAAGVVHYSLVDPEELPNGVRFKYYATATFTGGTVSGSSESSNRDTVTAVNDAPVANPALPAPPAVDSYSVNQGASLTVPATCGGTLKGVLCNDTDDDSPATSLRAVLVSGPAAGNALTLNSNGSFTYTPAASFYGNDSFTYNVYDGCLTPEEHCSDYSNPATVAITVNRVGYDALLVNVQNLPPPSTKSFKPGSSVPLAWQWNVGGVVVDTPDADSKPSIEIVKPGGGTLTFTPEFAGSSSFQYFTTTKTHQFNWQTKTPTGVALPSGPYTVYVKSGKTGQTFGPFPVVLK